MPAEGDGSLDLSVTRESDRNDVDDSARPGPLD
jgi:hypothetical protein